MPPASRRTAHPTARALGTVKPGTRATVPPRIPLPQPGASPASATAANPVLPRFSEFVALLHHETQSVIEYLAQPQVHEVSAERPSEALVKIERMKVEMPVRLLPEVIELSKEGIEKLPVLLRPFSVPGRPGLAFLMRVEVLSPKLEQTTLREGMLTVEFSVAAK